MILVGLTGGIASGKSTVSAILKNSFHCAVIDADLIAREVVQPDRKAFRRIVDAFGRDVLLENGTLDRAKLGEIIFKDEGKRRKLNSITHPEIGKAIFWLILKHFLTGRRFIILDIPLLFESRTWANFTTINVVVYCTQQIQISRLVNRNDLSEEDALNRIESQMSLEEKKNLATVVIDNNGSREDTYKQVEQLYDMLNLSKRYLWIRGFLLCAFGIAFSFIFQMLR